MGSHLRWQTCISEVRSYCAVASYCARAPRTPHKASEWSLRIQEGQNIVILNVNAVSHMRRRSLTHNEYSSSFPVIRRHTVSHANLLASFFVHIRNGWNHQGQSHLERVALLKLRQRNFPLMNLQVVHTNRPLGLRILDPLFRVKPPWKRVQR